MIEITKKYCLSETDHYIVLGWIEWYSLHDIRYSEKRNQHKRRFHTFPVKKTSCQSCLFQSDDIFCSRKHFFEFKEF